MTAIENDHRYGIGTVAKLTGLSDHTIRVWERRYEAVVAERAPNGRRLYSAADVEKLGMLKSLTDQGIAISQIAGDGIEQLRERAASLSHIPAPPMPNRINVAVLGEFLPGLLDAHPRELGPVEVVIADANRDRFVADISRHDIDVVVLETPVLDAAACGELRDYMTKAGAARGVLVYSFGRGRDVDATRDEPIVALRAPIDADSLQAAVVRAQVATGAPAPRLDRPARDETHGEWAFAGPVAPRRFSQQQLARLANASTAIDCECPHHLAQLVGDLSAFEVYSENCANRDDDDAALHRYLHRTTAEARALIEVALEKVARAEGLDY